MIGSTLYTTDKQLAKTRAIRTHVQYLHTYSTYTRTVLTHVQCLHAYSTYTRTVLAHVQY